MNTRRFSGKHVVVTGAGSGIGRATALRLGEEGARLTLLGRTEERLADTASALPDGGCPAACVLTCDISDRAQVEHAMDSAMAAHGPLYALIANAGIGGMNVPGEGDRFDDIVSTNVAGTYWCMRAAQSRLADGPGPRHIVVISSVFARVGAPGYSALSASKAAQLGLVRVIAMELASKGVQVNAICPGWVNTAMADAALDMMQADMGLSRDQTLAAAMEGVPLGFMNEPADIAGTVAYLLSSDARGITGQAIDQNGGLALA